MPDFCYELPVATLATLVTVVFVGVYWLGCIALRPIFRQFVHSYGGDNEIVGSVMATFGVLYGLLLSLIAVAANQSQNLVESQVQAEASALFALYRDAGEYPSPLREQLQSQLLDYCEIIIQEEWPLLRQGTHPLAHHHLEPIFQGLVALEHETRRDEVIQSIALEHFADLSEQGRHRRLASGAAIPTVMWYVVIVGTVINFALMWSFEMRFITQLFLGGLVAFFLGAFILLIAVLERPYRSPEFGVSPHAFELVYEIMREDGKGPSAATLVEEP